MAMRSRTLMKVTMMTVLLLTLFFLPAHAYASDLGDLRISLMEGDVQVRTVDTGDWVPASINAPLMDGDILWVPDKGRAAVQFRDGSYVRLDEKTSLEVLRLERNSYQFYLTEGRAYVNFKASRGSFLQMDTPVSSVRVYDPSIFRVDVGRDDLTRIHVVRGRVDAESEAGKMTVNYGNALALGRNRYAEISPLSQPDAWDRWNAELDRRLESRASARYLPDELQPYSPDFDEHGRWVYVREYGYVWTPTVVVSAGWAPYRVGRWTWMRGDYVWVSYEPWGWAPYHYGRWDFVATIGWFWVPPVRGAVYWGPGFVGWVYTPTYVSWVPLAPREIYYGHGYYGPHSVNVTHVDITHINVTNVVYKNVHVHNSVTVLHRDTFVDGKKRDVHMKENPFLKEKIHAGRPDIKPERRTLMPAVRDIPDRKRPPEKVREIPVKETKEKRPVVNQRTDSVLTPKRTPMQMEVKVHEVKSHAQKSEPAKRTEPEERTGSPKKYIPPGRTTGKPQDQRPQEREMERAQNGRTLGQPMNKPREAKTDQKSVDSSENLGRGKNQNGRVL